MWAGERDSQELEEWETDRGGQCNVWSKVRTVELGSTNQVPHKSLRRLYSPTAILGLSFQICKMEIMVSLL